MNSLELPLYFFLFVSKGLEQGRKLNLVGEQIDISHALRLLRIYPIRADSRRAGSLAD
jgi:hypothetical protein